MVFPVLGSGTCHEHAVTTRVLFARNASTKISVVFEYRDKFLATKKA